MRRSKYTAEERKKLKKRFEHLTQDDLLEVAKDCDVAYSTVRVVKNMHKISTKIINALIAKTLKYENAEAGE